MSIAGSWRTFKHRPWLLLLLAMAMIAMPQPQATRAQLLDPPPGWDLWDPTWPGRDRWERVPAEPNLRLRLDRHKAFMEQGPPEAYREAYNPLPNTPVSVEAGGKLYRQHCASCHDDVGGGHGDAGLALYPSPALLAHLIRMPSRADTYLLWTIAEGGISLGTDMPAFKDTLSHEQIWQVVTYMRAGFPKVGSDKAR